ncbi:MAG: NAD-dependent epimerase/dehydratase family protein [Gammaproteobacteria bacterium]|nr:NAD-dependent epimerase/dehydratase family protein [Gammaproteobacteria bacterium]
MKLKSAFVTGSTGFVGANLVRELLARGVTVRALVRAGTDLSNLQGLDIEFVEGNLLNPAVFSDAMAGCDACFHIAAAYSHPDRSELYRVNAQGTESVLTAAFGQGVPAIVYVSTMGTLSRKDGGLLTENDRALDDAASDYVRSKYEGEKIADRLADSGAPVSTVHLAAPVGPWDRVPTVTGKRLLAVLRGKAPAYLPGALNHVPVSDVAVGLIHAAERGQAGRHYLLAHPDGNLSRRDFVRMVRRAAGISIPVRGSARRALRAMKDRFRARAWSGPVSLACDPTQTITELGLSPTSLDDAFAQAVTWFGQHGRTG